MRLEPSTRMPALFRACLVVTFSSLATLLPGQELLPPPNRIPFQVAPEASDPPQELMGPGDPTRAFHPGELDPAEFHPEDFAPKDEENLELLTRGPLHEAFAVSPSDEPLPGVIVQRKPPVDVHEIPPEYEAAEGDESESIWIPGYWAWDEDREDFIWVSGAWRVSPPDRTWIPGYWHETDNGHQWISGFWAPLEVKELSYVEPPPATLENGPSIPAPSEQHFWIPGNWVHQTNSYNWHPGRWCAHREDRVWVPTHYVYTPSGCICINGYWDYQLPLRGQLYAPVYFQRPVVTYRPRCEIRADNLFMHLFVSRRHRHYFFGDYYDARYRDRGCYPLHNYRYASRHYDPLFSYYRTHFALQGIDCRARLSGWHSYYTRHVHHRPPRTWSGYTSFGIHLASHPHLSRTALAHAPRYASTPKEPRTTMPRNSVTRPPKRRHDDAIVDPSTLGRHHDRDQPSRGGHRPNWYRDRNRNGPDRLAETPSRTNTSPSKGVRKSNQHKSTLNDRKSIAANQRDGSTSKERRLAKKDLKAQAKLRQKKSKLNHERERKGNPPKVRPAPNATQVVRGNHELDNSISHQLEQLAQRVRPPVASGAIKPTSTPRSPKMDKSRKTRNVVHAPDPSPRTVTMTPRQVPQPRQVQTQPTRQPRQAQPKSMPPTEIAKTRPAPKPSKAPKSVTRSTRAHISTTNTFQQSSQRMPKSSSASRASKRASPSSQSIYQMKQPKTRNVQPRPVQPRSSKPSPSVHLSRSAQTRSAQTRSAQRSRPAPSPSTSRSSQQSTNRDPKPQRAPKQKKSRSGKKER